MLCTDDTNTSSYPSDCKVVHAQETSDLFGGELLALDTNALSIDDHQYSLHQLS